MAASQPGWTPQFLRVREIQMNDVIVAIGGRVATVIDADDDTAGTFKVWFAYGAAPNLVKGAERSSISYEGGGHNNVLFVLYRDLSQ